MRDNPATAVGEITAKDCAKHALRWYKFDVDGKTYGGGGSSAAGGNCEAIRVSEPVLIHYERSNPGNNIGGDPGAALWNEIFSIALVALLCPPIILLAAHRAKARRTR